jgi:hypothetical protein
LKKYGKKIVQEKKYERKKYGNKVQEKKYGKKTTGK